MSHGSRSVAACLVGQPRSLSLTAEALRTNLLDHWDADAFVIPRVERLSWDADILPQKDASKPFHHRTNVRQSDGFGALRLRELLGPRVVVVDESAWNGTEAHGWWERHVGWHVYGHPHEQWANREDCATTIHNHEERRGARYDVYLRVRLDALLLQPFPLTYLAQVRAGPNCSALIPAGEDYGGVNDRLLIADRCAFSTDASILSWITTVRERVIREHWHPEEAYAQHLTFHGLHVLRKPLASCLLKCVLPPPGVPQSSNINPPLLTHATPHRHATHA